MSCILISEDAASIVIVRPSSYRPSQREPRLEIAGLGQRPHPLELDLIGLLSWISVNHEPCVGMDVLQSFRRSVEVTVEERWHGIGPVPGPNGFVKSVSTSCL